MSPEAKEHFLAGRLTLGDCYQIASAKDQAAKLADILKRGKHAQAESTAKPEGGAPNGRVAKVKIPLAVNKEDYSANGLVTISSLPGKEIDWDGAMNLLKEALRSIQKAKDNKWSVKSAMATWRDVASPG